MRARDRRIEEELRDEAELRDNDRHDNRTDRADRREAASDRVPRPASGPGLSAFLADYPVMRLETRTLYSLLRIA
jgi:hypothetical protein